jgi:hypothetical protein
VGTISFFQPENHLTGAGGFLSLFSPQDFSRTGAFSIANWEGCAILREP